MITAARGRTKYMSVKEILLLKLQKGGYQWPEGKKPFIDDNLEDMLGELEKDRENVFRAIYGEATIADRGTKPVKEWVYRYGEALQDLKGNLIKMTMHYLIMQIHINAIKL